MESTICGKMEATKYRNAPGEIGVSRGLAPQIGAVMRPKYNRTPNPNEYSTDPETGAVRVSLRSKKHPGLFALIEPEDETIVRGYSWRVRLSGGVYYAVAYSGRVNGYSRSVGMHRLILGVDDPKVVVDHINHDGLDNRRANLRAGTQQQNLFNSRSLNPSFTSAYKGVFWSTREKKWVAKIRANGTVISLGNHDDEVFAARVYDVAAIDLFGEFAHLNFSDSHEHADAVDAWRSIQSGPNHSSKYRGVWWRKPRSRWVAKITVNVRHRVLGSFVHEEDAARAYDAAAREAWGDKARLNFPEEGGDA